MNNSCIFKKVVMMFLLLVGTLNVYSQHVVTGKVIDEQGPLIGASVTVKDAAVPTGTVTDAEGKYSIKVPNSKTILVYSYIGYVDKAEAVGKRTVVNVTLEEDSKMLDDVVVIGYGTQAKSHLTGSISKLEGEKLINAPVSDVTTALQGAMTGLTVSNETSEVGVTPSIRVRGTGSISADSEPLVIIDGFPVSGGLSSINAADVKSIEILKDAASTAIYGARANGGVILIETKSGKEGKTSVNYKFKIGKNFTRKGYEFVNAEDYIYYNRLGMLRTNQARDGRMGTYNVDAQAGYGVGNALYDIRYLTDETAHLQNEGWSVMNDPYYDGKQILFRDYNGQLDDEVFSSSAITQDHYLNITGGNDTLYFELM